MSPDIATCPQDDGEGVGDIASGWEPLSSIRFLQTHWDRQVLPWKSIHISHTDYQKYIT